MSAELDYPAWPPGLTDYTALPYGCWRIMHVTDGRRSVERVAQAVGSAEPQVRQMLTDVRLLMERIAVREQPLTAEIQETLRQALNSVVGPMGELMIDDALDDLPEDAAFSALLSSVNAQLSETHRRTLSRILRTRGLA